MSVCHIENSNSVLSLSLKSVYLKGRSISDQAKTGFLIPNVQTNAKYQIHNDLFTKYVHCEKFLLLKV